MVQNDVLMRYTLIVLESVVISVLGSLARFPSTYSFMKIMGYIMHKKMLDGNTKRTRNAMEKNLCNFALLKPNMHHLVTS